MGFLIIVGAALMICVGVVIVRWPGFIRTPISHRPAHLLRRVDVADQQEIVRAVAVWTENLRDAISASSGLEQAITSTAGHSPDVIDVHLQRLVGSLKYRPLDECLRDFAMALANPTSDFVVASLLVSLRHPTRDMSALLSHLSDCARAECDLYLRVWVSRARSRTSVRIINFSVLIFSFGLVSLNPSYVAPFLTRQGGFFLVCIALCFLIGLTWLRRISTLAPPQRFLYPMETP
jgi:Flp pilus assembly protein TadB